MGRADGRTEGKVDGRAEPGDRFGRGGVSSREWLKRHSSMGAKLPGFWRELPVALAVREREGRTLGKGRELPLRTSGMRGVRRPWERMGGAGGGRAGGGGILLALPPDDVEPPRVLDMGKSAPPGRGA